MDIYTEVERVRAKSARRRAAGWACVPEYVLGLPLSPITPATYDLLSGTANAFVSGLPPTLADVRNFMLYHSPGFDPDAPQPRFPERLWVNLRIERAICPLFTPRKRRAPVTARNFLQAVGEIRAIVTETWADSLPGNDQSEQGPSIAASLHAQLSDMFAREYGHWPHPKPLRHTPIAQLFQLARCSDRQRLGGAATYFDQEEAGLLSQWLKQANERAQAARFTTPAPPATPARASETAQPDI